MYNESFNHIYEINRILLLPGIDLNRRIKQALHHITTIPNYNAQDILRSSIPSKLCTEINVIQPGVSAIEHIAWMFPARTDLATLAIYASATGLSAAYKTFPSIIVAKELGALLHLDTISTSIVKFNRQNTFNIELFIPNTDSDTVNQWISQNICSHVALKVDSISSLNKIHQLISQNSSDESQLHLHSINNTINGGCFFYLDTVATFSTHTKLRLEFVYI